MSDYTDEQDAIRRTVRDFARREVAPGAAERDATTRFDYDLYRRLGELGVPGLTLPQEYGGAGADLLTFCLAVEEIARVDLSLSWSVAVAPAGAQMIAFLGTPEQKAMWTEQWVKPVARGEAVSAAAITEPDAGSDTARLQTRAVLDGDEWVINGSKAFITNTGLDNCAFATVLCLTDAQARRFDTIIVPTGTTGYRIMPAYRKMGLRSCDTRELAFEDCRVPAVNRIGAPGGGRGRIVRGFFAARITLASTALGLAQECLEIAAAYARERHTFGRPIASYQYIQGMLVEMALNLELGRLIRDKAARLLGRGQPHAREAAMAKWFCAESAKQAADYAVQVFGGAGFMDECPASRYYRDIRAATIADGTTQIQKHIIARELGLLG
ncbi:MAG TPA: acyl-CoA dehydrogenase family protein [Dehalococcoidia bacterium]|nr:acyl-CoA dehydrogenase family protein [Dehalococcoidia bacterium]